MDRINDKAEMPNKAETPNSAEKAEAVSGSGAILNVPICENAEFDEWILREPLKAAMILDTYPDGLRDTRLLVRNNSHQVMLIENLTPEWFAKEQPSPGDYLANLGGMKIVIPRSSFLFGLVLARGVAGEVLKMRQALQILHTHTGHDGALETTEDEAKPYQSTPVPRCEYCDGTGDVHSQTGEWRGTCQPCADADLLAALEATAKGCPGFETGLPIPGHGGKHFSTAHLTQQQDELFSLLAPDSVLRLVELARQGLRCSETVLDGTQALEFRLFPNDGSQPEDTAHLDCPACGGSGHRADVADDNVVDAEWPPASTEALQLAAKAWQEPGTSHLVMDSRLAEAFGRILDRQRAQLAGATPALLKFDPKDGLADVYPSEAHQYREYHGMVAWLFDPFTGGRRDARDVGSDPFGLLMVAPAAQEGGA